MPSDNHIRGHQIRIVAFLNSFSTGTLILHRPGKDFLYYAKVVRIPGTSFALLSRSKKWKERQENSIFHCPSLPSLLESFLFSAQNGRVLRGKSGLCSEPGSNLQTMLLTQALPLPGGIQAGKAHKGGSSSIQFLPFLPH